MEETICKRAPTVGFWDGYARWYKHGMDHNHYHGRAVNMLMVNAMPRWRVLDIGSGNGVLSLPLCAIGCEVTALEPSVGMRKLLNAEAFSRGIDRIQVDAQTWEQVPSHAYRDLDLIMASNSLHPTKNGFTDALGRIFSQTTTGSGSAYINEPENSFKRSWPNYQTRQQRKQGEVDVVDLLKRMK